MGCIWLADLKFDWEGDLFLPPVPVAAGSRYGIWHCCCNILPLSKIVRARMAIYGEDDDKWGPDSVYALCDVQDGNYVLVDVSHGKGVYPLFDGDHEAWPDPIYCRQVARSFSEFLKQVLHTRRNLYWLGE